MRSSYMHPKYRNIIHSKFTRQPVFSYSITHRNKNYVYKHKCDVLIKINHLINKYLRIYEIINLFVINHV